MAETEAALQSKNTPIQRVEEWLARRAERPQSEAIRDGVEMAIDALSKALRESVRGRELGVGEWGEGFCRQDGTQEGWVISPSKAYAPEARLGFWQGSASERPWLH
eukprot:scaffold297_cov108-Isochrysis_galbana.AAC.25